jgi:hypothetical protein
MDPVLADPTESFPAAAFSLAPRTVHDLRGKTVGLLVNTKYNSDTLLDCIGALLHDRHGVAGLVRESKPSFARPLPDELAASLAARCDVVVTAIGD